MSVHERLYLDKLERMIASPDRTPYIRRDDRKTEPEESSAKAPVYDSGPMAADQKHGGAPGAATSETPIGRRQPSAETEDGRVRMGTDGIYELDIDVPSADLDLDEDSPREEPSRPQPVPAAQAKPTAPVEPTPETVPREGESAPSKNLFPEGTIILWDTDQVGIYMKHLEEKGYDLVHIVEDDGRLHPKGICLFAYEPRRIGLLSEGILQWMEQRMRWARDALLHHLDNPADAEAIPNLPEAVAAQGREPAPAAPNGPASNNGLVRGRTFTVAIGDRQWHGVFWDRDLIGTIVAHNTNRVWTLMHLDLRRFGSSLELGDLLPQGQIEEIEAAVSE